MEKIWQIGASDIGLEALTAQLFSTGTRVKKCCSVCEDLGKLAIIQYLLLCCKKFHGQNWTTPTSNSVGISSRTKSSWNFLLGFPQGEEMDAVLPQSDANLGLHWLSCPSRCQETSVWSTVCVWAESLELKETPTAVPVSHGRGGRTWKGRAEPVTEQDYRLGERNPPQLTRGELQSELWRFCRWLGPQVDGETAANWTWI